MPLSNLAEVARIQGDYQASQAYLEECLAIDQEAGSIGDLGIDLENLAFLCLLQDNLAESRRNYLRSLEYRRQLGTSDGIAKCLEGLAVVAMASAAGAEQGARVYSAAEALRKSIGMPLPDSFKGSYQPFLERGRQALGNAAWEKALQDVLRKWNESLGVEVRFAEYDDLFGDAPMTVGGPRDRRGRPCRTRGVA